MAKLRIRHKESDKVLASDVYEAKGILDLTRVTGLMFKKGLVGMDGLLIQPCTSIHTCFMRFEMDALFIDKGDKVVHVIRRMKPWRFSWFYPSAAKVLELNGGAIPAEVSVGHQLEVSYV